MGSPPGAPGLHGTPCARAALGLCPPRHRVLPAERGSGAVSLYHSCLGPSQHRDTRQSRHRQCAAQLGAVAGARGAPACMVTSVVTSMVTSVVTSMVTSMVASMVASVVTSMVTSMVASFLLEGPVLSQACRVLAACRQGGQLTLPRFSLVCVLLPLHPTNALGWKIPARSGSSCAQVKGAVGPLWSLC